MEERLVSVVLAGGKGERFWPLSRSTRPKQFLRLLPGGQSLIEATVERLLPLSGWERTLVATSLELAPLIRDHLPDLPKENLILEPSARDTAPAAAWAALEVARRFGGDTPMGFFP
ncbi:sugar phosphate nucleotidyltransferase, partial [Oceanithermus sp.]